MDLHQWRSTGSKKVEKEKTKGSIKERTKEENGLQHGDIYVAKVVDVDSKEKERTKEKEKESPKESPRALTKARTRAKENLGKINAVNACSMDIGPETVPIE